MPDIIPIITAPPVRVDSVVGPLVDEALIVLTDVAQLIDGWHNDGTVWTEWDEQVRKRVSELQERLYETKRPNDRTERPTR